MNWAGNHCYPFTVTSMNWVKYFLLLSLLCLQHGRSYGQDFCKYHYEPVKYSQTAPAYSESRYLKMYPVSYRSQDKKVNQQYNQYLTQLQKHHAKEARKHQFIAEPWVNIYLQKLLDTLLNANNIKIKMELVCTRYPVANAFTLGDHHLYINIGLLEHLRTEAELAFLIGHELSHHVLFHIQDNFIERERRMKDKRIKKEWQNIRKARYNKMDKSFEFAKQQTYELARYSRQHEKSADSFALHLIQTCGYHLQAGQHLMDDLQASEKDSTVIDWQKWLGYLPDSWLKADTTRIRFGNNKVYEMDEDSSETHPDIPIRKQFLDTLKSHLTPASESWAIFSASRFDSLRAVGRFESVASYADRKRYAIQVYSALKYLETYPENAYLYQQAARGMVQIYEALRLHTIQNHLPLAPDPDFPPGYNQFLQILEQVTLDTYREKVQHFLETHKSKLLSDPQYNSFHEKLKLL